MSWLVYKLIECFNYVGVEWLIDYLQAMWMSALQIDVAQENVSFLTLEKKETGTDILLYFWKENTLQIMFRIKIFQQKM